jgi:putative alpha-1,2-mannosidase
MRMKKIIYSISIALICIMIFSFGSIPNNNYVKYVDPFIGSGGHGHVFVGANVPFGGVQVGPTNFNKGWDWSSSYHHSDSIVKGFCHLNVSGTGMSDLGELTVMPVNGPLKINAGTQENHMKGYSSLYRKERELVSPGYYSVFLERYNIKVELTASKRVGLHRYTYPKSTDSRIIIDLGEGSADRPTETFLRKINDTLFEGYRFSTGWAKDQREFFSVVTSKPVENFLLYDRGRKIKDNEKKGKYVKGFLEFETDEGEEVFFKMGVSTVSMKNALENLIHEIPHWNFEVVHNNAILNGIVNCPK